MNHAVRALVTLAFAAGLAAAAQAQGTSGQSSTAGATTPSTAPNAAMPSTTPPTAPSATTPSAGGPEKKVVKPARMARNATKARLRRGEVRQVQAQLKADGLYRGRIDGKLGRGTQLALSRFQQRNGLHRTASLDRMTENRLLGGRTVGFGSSTQPKRMAAPATGTQTGAGGDNATIQPKANRY
jgi:peptidoglycan hydrolase-like protein with peptidoglycan-binding domain